MSPPTRFASVLLAVVALGCATVGAAGPSTVPTTAPSRPNVIFILADDLGYGDVGVTFQNARAEGRAKFATPNLDALAGAGMLLQQHYSGSPVCAPARASLLLGQHQGDCPIRDNQFDKALPANHTLGTVMKAAGYHTIAIGKWGLQGPAPEYPGHPLRHGFDEFFGFLAHDSGHVYYQDAQHPLHDGFTDVTAKYLDVYSTDLFTARAKRFIIDHQAHAAGQPFFMYLAYTAPHMPQQLPGGPYPDGAGLNGGLRWPLAPTHETRDKWVDPAVAHATYTEGFEAPAAGEEPKPWGERMKRYATVIRRMDRCVGDLRQLLRDLRIDRDTLVVFTSDNGPSNEGIDPRRFDSWGPFDGFKRDLWEGGVREPTIVAWPGRAPAGHVSPFVSDFWDWMPTFADVAGLVPPAQADGVSLLPTLTDHGDQRSRGFVYEDYYFYSPPNPTGVLKDIYARKHVTGRGVQQMLREGDLVAIRTQVHGPDDPLRLYDVVADPHQDHDLSGDPKYAQTLRRMRDALPGIHRPEPSAPRPYDDVPVPAVTVPTTPGLVDAAVYEGRWPWVPDLDALRAVRTERTAGVDLSPLGLPADAGVKLSGYLTVPTDGRYTFWLSDDDGAQLWLHDAHVVDDDFNHKARTTATGSIPLRAGLHPFRLFYRHAGPAVPSLRWEYAGPGIARQAIPPSAFAVPADAATNP
jgi:arylsulfatase A-like enzyme